MKKKFAFLLMGKEFDTAKDTAVFETEHINIDKKSHFLHMSAGIDYSFGHANTVGYVTFIKDK